MLLPQYAKDCIVKTSTENVSRHAYICKFQKAFHSGALDKYFDWNFKKFYFWYLIKKKIGLSIPFP